jgi:hypothetical protein
LKIPRRIKKVIRNGQKEDASEENELSGKKSKLKSRNGSRSRQDVIRSFDFVNDCRDARWQIFKPKIPYLGKKLYRLAIEDFGIYIYI